MTSAPATPRIAIIGGGFSGMMILANLVSQAEDTAFSVDLFETNDAIGLGTAYSTGDTAHLLNVPAGRMGAFEENPGDFFAWLQTPEGKEHAAKLCGDKEIEATSFAPRVLYGVYLRHIHANMLKKAQEKNIEVHVSQATVTDASLYNTHEQQIMLTVERGGIAREVLVDALALATGNLPPRQFSFQTGLVCGAERYVADVWKPSVNSLYPHNVDQLSADSEVVILGTGLTMADTVLTLKAKGYKGVITAISRNGLLPAEHASCEAYPAWEWTMHAENAPRTALGLLRRFRREIAEAQAQGKDWRSVVDSVRPVTQTLWKRLSIREKRKFLDRLYTPWNIHRHRMAPEICAELKAMRQSGALRVLAAKIYYVGSDPDGMTVALRKRGTNRIETVRSPLVINCTGPQHDIASSSHHLLRNLRDNELITVGPLRSGIELTPKGTAKGRAPDAIFPIGTLLVGELLECTAVPELRAQASRIADGLLERLRAVRERRESNLLMEVMI